MKPTGVRFADPERHTVDLLESLLDDVPVSVGVPAGWTPDDGPHVQVVWDGTPFVGWPIYQATTIRVVVRAASTTQAKGLADQTRSLLAQHRGDDDVAVYLPAAGPQPAEDPTSRAALAWHTVRAVVRGRIVD